MTSPSKPSGSCAKDGFLALLNAMCNRIESGFSMSVTLTVHGAVVTGMMISAEEYFRLFGESFGGAFGDNEAADELKKRFREMGAEAKKQVVASDDDPAFIHLKDAHYVIGGAFAPDIQETGFLFRCYADDVTGFSPGAFGRR